MLHKWSTSASSFFSRSISTRVSAHRPRAIFGWTLRCNHAVATASRSGAAGSVGYTSSAELQSMTTAQVSRAAAEVVRVSALNGQFGDALYVVNSLHYSMHHTTMPSDGPPSKPTLKPIDFGQQVSPRLSAHTFLHALIRGGYTRKAARFAEIMMRQGISLRTSTLEAILQSLTPARVIGRVRSPFFPGSRFRKGANVLFLRSSSIKDSSTKAALHLLGEARRFGQQRSQRMYENLVSTCLMQGEIIVASLLFVLLVEDWQAHKAHKTDPKVVEVGQSPAAEKELFEHSVVKAKASILENPRTIPAYPRIELLELILNEIRTALSNDPQDLADIECFRSSLQALANLAMLLENGSISTGRISSLIRTLYLCPRTDHTVWIFKNGEPTEVTAYLYFNGVLRRVIDSLHVPGHPLQRLPPLDRRAYNSLLHYALRHRLSPPMASIILEHMCFKREPPLQPDVTTYNIFIRAGTLLHLPKISVAAIKAMCQTQADANYLSISVSPISSQEDDMRIDERTRFSRALRRLQPDQIELVELLRKIEPPDTKADTHTLTGYVMHLISTGNPQAVADVLFTVLPELNTVDHPSWGKLTIEERQTLITHSGDMSLKRAVELGPTVFAVFLNALTKAGKTGLAERVWLLAKKAERASRIPDFVPGVKPWCLTIHAYTSMLQCYAAEARRGAQRSYKIDPGDQYDWSPASKDAVRGWAKFVYIRQRMAAEPHLSRSSVGRILAARLVHSMMSGGKAVFDSFVELQNEIGLSHPKMSVPIPDARFFNAALSLFGRPPGSTVRRRRRAHAYWRRMLLLAYSKYAARGAISKRWDPMLQEISQEIMATGHSVPYAFRHLFVGRWMPMSWGKDNKRLNRAPYAFPPPQLKARSHSLYVAKSRGLPLGRARRRIRSRV